MELFKKAILLILLSSIIILPSSYSQTKILPLGDSITQGQNNGTDKQYNSYRRALWLLLQNDGQNVDFIGSMNQNFSNTNPPNNDFDWDHEGHWGWRADEVLNGRNSTSGMAYWLGTYTPDIALIHLGSNDCIQNQDVNDTVTELEGIITALQNDNPNVEIFLAKIIYTKRSDWNTRVDALNALIPGIASSKATPTSPVTIVDINALINPNIHLYDNAHPNTTGEQIMAQAWFDAMNLNSLPVTLNAISAKNQDGKLALNWSTSLELNSKEFEVQVRREDQQAFEKIGTVAAAGNSASLREYEFLSEDLQPAKYLTRLKMIDIDGTFEYSKTLEVNITESLVHAFTKDSRELQIDFLKDIREPLKLELYNMSGQKLIDTQLLTSSPTQYVKLAQSAGIYYVKISSARSIVLSKKIQVN